MNGWRDLKSDNKITIVSIIMAISAVLIINHIHETKAAHFADPGNITIVDGHGDPDFGVELVDVAIIPNDGSVSRQEQIKLMSECVEDAIMVGQWWEKKVYELTNTVLSEEDEHGISELPRYNPEIAVAFFNYRTGGDHVD